LLQDIFLVPYRLVKNVACSVSQPGLPWIAFVVTLAWCLLEALIFTYVMTPLVMDTLSNMTGETLSEAVIRIPLFIFMFFLILGSYAVLSTFATAVASRDTAAIFRILVIEMVAVFVEVMFLYREFVDSLVPWFAQYASQGFELGMPVILGIAFGMWARIRGMTWYLFASYGTPTVLAILRGSGLATDTATGQPDGDRGFSGAFSFYHMVEKDMAALRDHGQHIAEAVVLPPLQVAAAGMNFLSLLVAARPMLDFPLAGLSQVMQPHSAAESKKNSRTRKTPVAADPLGQAAYGHSQGKGGVS
jgi:hypothetical protein